MIDMTAITDASITITSPAERNGDAAARTMLGAIESTTRLAEGTYPSDAPESATLTSTGPNLASPSVTSPSTTALHEMLSALVPAVAHPRPLGGPDRTVVDGAEDVDTTTTGEETALMATKAAVTEGTGGTGTSTTDRGTGLALNGERTQLLLIVRDETLKRAVKTRIVV